MIPDPYEKKVVIPVRIRNGVVESYYAGKLPALEENAVGELVLPFNALKDRTLVGPLGNHLDVPFLPRWTRLFAGLNPSEALPAVGARYNEDVWPTGFRGFAEIVLLEALELRLRGSKRAMLKPCKCRIPALGRQAWCDGKAESVNHAYTVLSEKFEPQRVSHTGNVFDRVFYRSADVKGRRVWEPLRTLRDRIEPKLAIRLDHLIKG